jgi:glycine C-acetyltransferase
MPAQDTHPFIARARGVLDGLRERGELKTLQTITGPMGPVVRLAFDRHGRPAGIPGSPWPAAATDIVEREALCFCSNNYLGLADHPEVVEAGRRALTDYGAGTASVRFICGSFAPHWELEARIARFLGAEAAYTFVSAWTANEAVFPTLCQNGDAIISDALNHACIIDGIRLCGAIHKGVHRFVYRNNDTVDLEARLVEAAAATREHRGVVWVVTDGVFSMEGSVADLPRMRELCDRHGALLIVDDSHGTGVMGDTGRGTHEHYGMPGERIDIFTGTLGKALGGAAGGFVAARREAIELLVQRGRPTLFSNALPVTVAASAGKALEILEREPERVRRLRDNTAYARRRVREAGFDVLDSPTAICPIIVHETARAIEMSRRLLELGVYVIGFGFPVVPEGHARLRVQISAAHERAHIDALVDALRRL